MALKVVNTESLDAVANAINAKSGTSGALQFPDGFVEAIGAIQAGGGGEDLSTVLAEQEELVAELKSIIAQKAKLGDAKLPSIIERTVTEITAEDLAGVTKIGNYAFIYHSNLKSISLPNSVTEIGKQAFYQSVLENISMLDGITRIGDNSLRETKLTNVTVPNSVSSIGEYAFYECKSLESVSLPNNLVNISQYTFYYCSKLASIDIPDSVEKISSNAFAYSGIVSLKLSKNLKRLYGNTFYGCSNLTNVKLPKSLTQMSSGEFRDCKLLEYVDLTDYGTDGAFPSLGNSNAFQNCGINTASGTFQIRVHQGRKAELAAMTNWSTYADNIVEV